MASYNWLKATLFQYTIQYDQYEKRIIGYCGTSNNPVDEKNNKEQIETLNAVIKQKQEFIDAHLTKEKDKNREQEQAKKGFISAANWSWNTEDVLKLMEEGLVPTDLVKDILNDASWTNNILCLFNHKVSLKHLIASKNIQILSYNNKCVALNPERSHDENARRIKELFGKTNLKDKIKDKNVNLNINIHGTGGYVNDFNIKSDLDVVLTLSNIPSGLVAINGGIRERVDICKDIVSNVIQEFDAYRKQANKKNEEQNKEAHENEDMITKKNKIMISSISFGNLFAALLANELTKGPQKLSIDVLAMQKFPYSFYFFQSIDDIADTLKNDNCVKNIKEVWIPDISDGVMHHKSLSQELRQSFQDFVSNVGERFKVKNIAYYSNGGCLYQGEYSGNNRSGNGSEFDRNGNLYYIGEWKDDCKNGGGTRILKLYGTLVVQEKGIFKNNEFTKGIEITKNNGCGTIVFGKGTFSPDDRSKTSKIMFKQGSNGDIIQSMFINGEFVSADNEQEMINEAKRMAQEKNLSIEEQFTQDEIDKYKQMYKDFLKELSSGQKKQENIENSKKNIIKNVNNNEICTKQQESEDKKINTQINDINNIEASEDKEHPIGTDNNKPINHGNSKLNLSVNHGNKIELQ